MMRTNTASMSKDTTNKDGLPVRKDKVGLAAAMDKDGVTSVHDRKMPDIGLFPHSGGGLKPFDFRESRDYHERIEDAEIQAGKDYYEAHRVATEAEHARMRQLGFDPNLIEDAQKPYIDAVAHEARARGDTSSETGNEPYRVSGESGMREDGDAKDRRFILDRDGNRYDEPSHDKLLGQTEIVIAKRSNGAGFAVIDPNSGWVFARGATRIAATKRAEKMANDMGRSRLKDRFEKQPALSQQQLRERFKDIHPEARIKVVPIRGDTPKVKENAPDKKTPKSRNPLSYGRT